jgi:hypothetical protein
MGLVGRESVWQCGESSDVIWYRFLSGVPDTLEGAAQCKDVFNV